MFADWLRRYLGAHRRAPASLPVGQPLDLGETLRAYRGAPLHKVQVGSMRPLGGATETGERASESRL